MLWLLFYDYVEDIIDRRTAFRDSHLSLVWETAAQGPLLVAGALAEPLDGAVFVFAAEDRSSVEDFVGRDPYVQQGLVTAWRVRPWTVVVGGDRLAAVDP